MRIGAKSTLGLLSATGVVGTHMLAYLFGEPRLGAQTRPLFAAAHSHWNYVLAAGVACFVYVFAKFVASRWSGQSAATPRDIVLWSFPRLSLLHLVGFFVLETLEISFTGGDAHHMLAQSPILTGLVIGILVAALASFVLGLVAFTVDLVLARGHRSVIGSSSLAFGPVASQAGFDMAARAWGLRGPPTTQFLG